MNLKAKSVLYGVFAVIAVLLVNAVILSFLGFPLMATEIIKKYLVLFILLIGGLGLQVGLFTYFNNLYFEVAISPNPKINMIVWLG